MGQDVVATGKYSAVFTKCIRANSLDLPQGRQIVELASCRQRNWLEADANLSQRIRRNQFGKAPLSVCGDRSASTKRFSSEYFGKLPLRGGERLPYIL